MKKYGRTFHLPLSPGATSDDKIMSDVTGLQVDDLVVTEKMDGENTTIYSRGAHARSPDSRAHPSRDWLKGFAAGVSHRLAPDERIIGEYLYARHSIAYTALPSYFLGFAWVKDEIIQSWPKTQERFATLGIISVPILYRGPYRTDLFESLAAALNPERQEGFVVRTAMAFPEADMPHKLGKYVRPNHVQSAKHWMHQAIVPNTLA